ncbi:MAG: signal peptide peptidase SppA [Dehalococcoidia bacterium]|nr:MAG: signal peptide peptidase SppA [Dehalococcoidia bacterium]
MSRILLSLLIVLSIIPMVTSCSDVGNKIAVIPLNGVIEPGPAGSFWGGSSITPDLVRRELEKVNDDLMIRAIVIQVNSPGGDVSACEEIAYEMAKVKKPIVISMRSVAASGGYYISAKADKIVALQSTLTGSIGVISEMPNLSGLMDKIGVKMEIIKSGKYKDMYSGFAELTPEERAIEQKTTDQMYEQFINVVAEGRHLSKEKVRELATGQAYTGLEAKQLGLVDELGGIQTAINLAAKLANVQDPVTEYIYPQSPGLIDVLLNGSGSQLIVTMTGGLMGAEQMAASSFLNRTYPRFLYR